MRRSRQNTPCTVRLVRHEDRIVDVVTADPEHQSLNVASAERLRGGEVSPHINGPPLGQTSMLMVSTMLTAISMAETFQFLHEISSAPPGAIG